MDRARDADRGLVAGAQTVTAIDPLTLDVMGHAMAAIAEEMGTVLERGALSPNIRERRDASCAVFDANGRMLAQAAHIPVHLGAMPEAVHAVMRHRPAPGDTFILNDPFAGGSHLPDLTLVKAVALHGATVGYAAVRAHHGDVGGISPGSMPYGATEIFQEGIIIPPVLLAVQGVVREDLLALLLANVRTPDERLGDLRAQLGACSAGAHGVRALIAREGYAQVQAAGDELLHYTETRVRSMLQSLGDRSGAASDRLEGDGVDEADIPVVVRATIHDGRLLLDFTGTATRVRGNVNCPLAVARAAAVFVLRTLLPDDVPTNGGIASVIDIDVPPDCLVNAQWPSAVAAGNVETSQRITDTIIAALADAGLDVPAQGQGTMNNVAFGGDGWTFYETIGGGQGGTSRGAGPSAVHAGMSNTRNTPVESLEHALPLRIERYELRQGSGGAGRHSGGEGVVREYRANAPCTVTLLTERRRYAPGGAGGGGAGAPGRNLLNGRELPAKCRVMLQPGDVLRIETPGGGGFGKPRMA
jgi:N-methylhydantoinase B